jgi:hypothetical protein
MENLLDSIDEIKEKITSKEYKNIMDNLMEIHNNNINDNNNLFEHYEEMRHKIIDLEDEVGDYREEIEDFFFYNRYGFYFNKIINDSLTHGDFNIERLIKYRKEYINSNINNINWHLVSSYIIKNYNQHSLYYNFIVEYVDFLDWNIISKNLDLRKTKSYKFIKKFKNFFNWKLLEDNIKKSKDEKYLNLLNEYKNN